MLIIITAATRLPFTQPQHAYRHQITYNDRLVTNINIIIINITTTTSRHDEPANKTSDGPA